MKNERREHQAALLLAAVLALAALLGACGTDAPTGHTVNIPSGPVPNATTVGMGNCTSCHSSATESWKKGKHANMNDGNLNDVNLNGTGNPTLAHLDTQQNSGKCLSCHDALGDGRNELVAGYTGNTPRPVVGCESCHGGGSEHNGVGPIARTGAASSGLGASHQSSEFNTCTSICHATYGSGADYDFVAATHIGRTMSRHAAVPGDTRKNAVSSGTPSTVYFVKKADDNACTACHDPHENNVDLNKQYAESGHGNTTAVPWTTRNWKDPSNAACQRCHTSTGYRNYNSSLSSGTTYSAAQNDFTYLQQGTTATITGQNETLYCWACHTDYRGTLRNPGTITADYGYTTGGVTYAEALYSYPDVAGSNVCMACHTGRQNGDSIKNLNAAGMPSFNFGNQGFVNSHYLPAGGTVFTATGYEFSNRIYDSPMLYMHGKIGTAGAPGTGTNGPCVGCHMSFTPEKHHFLPVARSADGTITAVTSTVCASCHTGGDALPMSSAMLENEKSLLHESLSALKYHLDRRGYYFREAHPYFFKLRSVGTATLVSGATYDYVSSGPTVSVLIGDYFKFDNDGAYKKITSASTTQFTLESTYSGATTSGAYTVITSGSGNAIKSWLTTTTPYYPTQPVDTDVTGAVSGKNNMGAAFNFNLLEHDPGAFAHNRFYAKRLIYDSIDWLDDNNMNYSVGTTLKTVCSSAGAPAWCEGAKSYLLIYGVVPYSSAERP